MKLLSKVFKKKKTEKDVVRTDVITSISVRLDDYGRMCVSCGRVNLNSAIYCSSCQKWL